MDFETLFYLALLVIYVVYQIVGSRTQKPSPRPESPRPTDQPQQQRAEPSEAPDELDQALREIRQALGMEPPPVPEPPPTPEPEPPTAQHTPPLTPTTPSPRTAPHIPDEPPPEVTTEAVATSWVEDTLETRPPDADEEALLEEIEITTRPASAPTSRRPALLKRLREPGAAREAIVLSEILGPPRSRRR